MMTDEARARWRRLVSDWESTDLSQPEFARERGVSVHALRYWRYRLRAEAKGLPPPSEVDAEKTPVPAAAKEDLRLLPVHAVRSAPKARQPTSKKEVVELVLRSGICLRFPVGTDPRYLRLLVAALPC